MDYTVTGAVVNVNDGTALRVRLLQGLSAQVAKFEATVQIPTQFTYIKCTAGSPNSTVPCTFAAGGSEAAQIPTFRDGPRGEGEVVAIDIGFPAGTVAANERDRVSLDGRAGLLGRAAPAGPRPGPAGPRRHRPVLVAPACGRRRPARPARSAGWRVRADRTRTDRVPGGRRHPPRPCRDGGRRAGGSDRRHREPRRPGRSRPPDGSSSCLGTRSSRAPTGIWPGLPQGRTGCGPSSSNCWTASPPRARASRCPSWRAGCTSRSAAYRTPLYDEVVSNGWYERRPDATRSRGPSSRWGG